MEQLGTNRSSRERWCFLVAFSKLPGQFWLLSWVAHSPITVLSVRNSAAQGSAGTEACALCLYHFLLGAMLLKALLSACSPAPPVCLAPVSQRAAGLQKKPRGKVRLFVLRQHSAWHNYSWSLTQSTTIFEINKMKKENISGPIFDTCIPTPLGFI